MIVFGKRQQITAMSCSHGLFGYRLCDTRQPTIVTQGCWSHQRLLIGVRAEPRIDDRANRTGATGNGVFARKAWLILF